MTKKDFIKEIRKLNKTYREVIGGKCGGFFINSIYFCYEHIRLRFDDDNDELFIYDRNRNKIMACVSYKDLRIGFNI